jgi:hypothetical protein
VKKHGSANAAARATGACNMNIYRALWGSRKKCEAGNAHVCKPVTSGRSLATAEDGAGPARAKPVSATRTLADFRREHDHTWKIRDGLRRLFGGGVIMTDAEFREAVGGNPARWRAAADATEFRANRYRVGGEVLWAAANTIREMRLIRGEAI